MLSNTSKKNKAIVLDFFNTVLVSGKLNEIRRLVSPDIHFHIAMAVNTIVGIDQFESFFTNLFRSVPNPVITLEDVVAEDNKVVIRWTMSGKQKGDFMNLPPSDSNFKLCAISIYRVENDKIVEKWTIDTSFWSHPVC